MANITIIGGGAFGTAMACVTRRSGNEVTLWAREAEVVESLAATRENARFLPGVRVPEGIRATDRIETATAGADFVLMAVPAQHMRAIAAALAPRWRRDLPAISCSKGVETGSGQLMPEVLADMLPTAAIGVLSGPSFAREIAEDRPCGVMLASREWSMAEAAARAIANPRFCVHVCDDPLGVAIGGAMKNIVSIASGIAHARGLGENARSTLVTLGLAEAARLVAAKGGKAETLLGLAGAGDFMLTAHSLQSRNTSLGVAIGEGRSASEVLGSRIQVTEGAASVRAVSQLARRLGVDMPIVQALDDVLHGGKPLEEAIARLMQRLPILWRTGAPRPQASLAEG